MKMPVTIEYINGEEATYIVRAPEWAKWEEKTGFTVQQIQEKMGVADILFWAFHAMSREARASGTPFAKSYAAWSDTVADVEVGEMENPKVIKSEVPKG